MRGRTVVSLGFARLITESVEKDQSAPALFFAGARGTPLYNAPWHDMT
ncbi:hypothetical protein ABI_22370 [Asticcacaulis biprosthecium C19]|uniref:Uncharacterized protein n=1 Tax=Asticcacaulis biprosthecium C19 TaxID=715226 RepID=F4QNB8_9CAUL|nr:hypothetical protein ABI_22370 [Asticcacaulis biprosthecium C19]